SFFEIHLNIPVEPGRGHTTSCRMALFENGKFCWFIVPSRPTTKTQHGFDHRQDNNTGFRDGYSKELLSGFQPGGGISRCRNVSVNTLSGIITLKSQQTLNPTPELLHPLLTDIIPQPRHKAAQGHGAQRGRHRGRVGGLA
ncbi:hypothetical protein KUCAC02_011128, partial [Chaenocephalus aceratus]